MIHVGLIVPANSNFVPSGLGRRPERILFMLHFSVLLFIFVYFLPSSFSVFVCLSSFFGCAPGTDCGARTSTILFLAWHLFVFFHRDAYF